MSVNFAKMVAFFGQWAKNERSPGFWNHMEWDIGFFWGGLVLVIRVRTYMPK